MIDSISEVPWKAKFQPTAERIPIVDQAIELAALIECQTKKQGLLRMAAHHLSSALCVVGFIETEAPTNQ